MLSKVQGIHNVQLEQTQRLQSVGEAFALRLEPSRVQTQGKEGGGLQGAVRKADKKHVRIASLLADDEKRDDRGFVRL